MSDSMKLEKLLVSAEDKNVDMEEYSFSKNAFLININGGRVEVIDRYPNSVERESIQLDSDQFLEVLRSWIDFLLAHQD